MAADDPTLDAIFSNPALITGSGALSAAATSGVAEDVAPITPTSSADSTAGIYSPTAPDYVSKYNTGIGSMERLMRSIYTPDQSTDAMDKQGTTIPAAIPTSPAVQAPTVEPTSTPGTDTDTSSLTLHSGYDRIVGNATTFGLDYGTGGNDAEDNGIGAFGANTRDKNLEGAALPLSVIRNSIGDYEHDPAIYNAIKNGDYKVAVTNQVGVTKIVPIVDVGPAEWTGNAIDLTYKTSHDLGTEGKAKVGYNIIGPGGETITANGYHPHSIKEGNWDDHIGLGSTDRTRQPPVTEEPEETKAPVKEKETAPTGEKQTGKKIESAVLTTQKKAAVKSQDPVGDVVHWLETHTDSQAYKDWMATGIIPQSIPNE